MKSESSMIFFFDLACIQYYLCVRKTLKILFLLQDIKLGIYRTKKIVVGLCFGNSGRGNRLQRALCCGINASILIETNMNFIINQYFNTAVVFFSIILIYKHYDCIL